MKRLETMDKWMKLHSRSIYGTTKSELKAPVEHADRLVYYQSKLTKQAVSRMALT
jgi:hypothetical protein